MDGFTTGRLSSHTKERELIASSDCTIGVLISLYPGRQAPNHAKFFFHFVLVFSRANLSGSAAYISIAQRFFPRDASLENRRASEQSAGYTLQKRCLNDHKTEITPVDSFQKRLKPCIELINQRVLSKAGSQDDDCCGCTST